jgi:hypothetical protein
MTKTHGIFLTLLLHVFEDIAVFFLHMFALFALLLFISYFVVA